MAYSKTTWTDGTTPVNASNLNKLEQAVSDNADAVDELSDFGSLLSNLYEYMGTAITSGSDLNNFTDCGKYTCQSGNTTSLTNCPLTSATSFSMYVFYQAPSNNGNRLQIIVPSMTTVSFSIYFRMYISGTWRAWSLITTTAA